MKYVLIACEESQTECIEFRKMGTIAFSCDLQPCSGGHPEWHIKGDAIKALYAKQVLTCDGVIHDIPGWNLVIAHPPCTFLSRAGSQLLFPNGVLNKERYQKGLEAKEFFMKFVKYGRSGSKIVIENPVPNKIFQLPMCNEVVQPYEFGEPYSKQTYLWLYGVPNLMRSGVLTEYKSWVEFYRDSKMRSKSFKGIAKAMAEQWCDII